MARPRHIDREALLDAVARVIVRDGTSRLTLDAVAAEAGISKASVIYDCKTKQGLLRALIVSRVEQYRHRHAALLETFGDRPEALALTAIEFAKTRTAEEHSLFLAISDAIARDPELLAPVHDLIREDTARILSGPHPRGLQLAILALRGLEETQRIGIEIAAEEHDRLMAEITWLAVQDPPA